MSEASQILRQEKHGFMFWCPGCGEPHYVSTSGSGPVWGFDGNVERPTFTPSILVRSGHYIPGHKPGDPCWCTFKPADGGESSFKCKVCHSFVRDGRIQFLSDCSHGLAGRTIPLPQLPAWVRDAA